MANILIIGCGDIGCRLAARLTAEGHHVTGLRRSVFTLPGGAALQADVTAPFRLAIAPPDYVFIILTPAASTREAYEHIYLNGLAHIRDALSPFRPRRVFFVSSTSVYGEDDGEWVDEETIPRPAGFNGEVLLRAEAAVAMAAWPATIVRFAGIYGPGRLRLPRWVESGRPVDPGLWSNRIHVDDAAGALAFLMESDLAGRKLLPLYLGADDEPTRLAEVLDWLARGMEKGEPPRTEGAKRESGRRVSNRRLKAAGWEPVYPSYAVGYRF